VRRTMRQQNGTRASEAARGVTRWGVVRRPAPHRTGAAKSACGELARILSNGDAPSQGRAQTHVYGMWRRRTQSMRSVAPKTLMSG
jgi:hypothetical protein